MIEPKIQELIDAGALFVINHSGGKDSQAMYNVVKGMVPARQLLIIHANLGEVEWDGVISHIKATIDDHPLLVCKNENKTFLEMVEKRGMFPSPQQRQCTSDLKRGPIEREIRRYLKAHPEFEGRIVNCMGLRAQESANRAKQKAFKSNEGNSIAGREWYDWLPIHHYTIDQVWKVIEDAGQKPHPAYARGMSRLSCRFCIMASDEDLRTAARLSPDLYQKYVDMEQAIGRTMMMPRGGVAKSLEEITGIAAGRPAKTVAQAPADAPAPRGQIELELEMPAPAM